MNKQQLYTIESYNKTAESFNNSIAQLQNYNHTYDFLLDYLDEHSHVLDLACGPANISLYLINKVKCSITGIDLSQKMLGIAQKNIPDGTFLNRSIIDFNLVGKFDMIINGFGLPYLTKEQAVQSIHSAYNCLKPNGIMYLSFMEGISEGFEKTSFGNDNEFYIQYHQKNTVLDILHDTGLTLIKEWELDYIENNGSITKDIIYIVQKK